MRLLSGTISRPSMAERGAAVWISSWPASPVSPSRPPARGWAARIFAGSGMRCSESSTSPEPSCSSSRTSPASSPLREPRALGAEDDFATYTPLASSARAAGTPLWDGPPTRWPRSRKSSRAWPNSGSMRNGTCSLRPESERRTSAAGSTYSRGEYPTPSATSYGSSQNEGSVPHDRPTRGTPSLETWARNLYPTPTAGDAKASGSRNAPGSKAHAGVSLSDFVATGDSSGRWATPKAHDGRGAPGPGHMTKGKRDLSADARKWSTPQAHDAKPPKTAEQVERGRAQGHGVSNLNEQASNWPTPTRGCSDSGFTRDPEKHAARTTGGNRRGHEGNELLRRAEMTFRSGPPDPMKTGAEPPSSAGRSRSSALALSPSFVEWLMGFPRGWTGCASSGMPGSRWWERMRSALLQLELRKD